jgi:hypothetical protein
LAQGSLNRDLVGRGSVLENAVPPRVNNNIFPYLYIIYLANSSGCKLGVRALDILMVPTYFTFFGLVNFASLSMLVLCVILCSIKKYV